MQLSIFKGAASPLLFTGDVMEILINKVKQYCEAGFARDVAQAARLAQEATKLYIRRTHPSTAFAGKKINDLIIKGAYKVENSGVVKANIYANYFARWYNTGAFGRVIRSGKYKGRKGPSYPARGNYFEQNAEAIKQYYLSYMLDYLKKNIKLQGRRGCYGRCKNYTGNIA